MLHLSYRPSGRPARAVLGVAGGACALALLGPATPTAAVPSGDAVVVATVPQTPWEIAPLPGGGAFVVQRDGGIGVLDAQDQLSPTAALARGAIPSVRKLLGLALAPDFASSGLAYLYVSQGLDPDGGGPATGTNGIWRLRASGTTLSVVSQVFAGIDSDGNHDGGRMVFGPDGALYVSTGDVHQPTRPQDLASLNGKILRFAVPTSGPLTVPADNPYVATGGNAPWVWSYGHRHPQGLAFTADGRLWETEHGPSGEQYGASYPGGNGRTGRDELNLIVRGGNYGWPLVSGSDNRSGMVAPAAVAGAAAWAPGGLAVGADGSLYAPFLAGQRLHRFDVSDGVVVGQGDHLTDATGQGRLRVAVARGQDLLVAQDGADGGRILRIPLSAAPLPPVVPPVPTVPGSGSPAVDAATVRTAARALAASLRRELRDGGRARLLAGRALSVRTPVPYAGTLGVRVRRGQDPRAGLLDRSTTTAGPGEATIRVHLSRAARARLGAGRPAYLTVTVTYAPRGGSAVTVTRRARLGPARS